MRVEQVLRRERQVVEVLDSLAPPVVVTFVVALVPDARDRDVLAILPIVELLEERGDHSFAFSEPHKINSRIRNNTFRYAGHMNATE